jgi:hypothetical protein
MMDAYAEFRQPASRDAIRERLRACSAFEYMMDLQEDAQSWWVIVREGANTPPLRLLFTPAPGGTWQLRDRAAIDV